MAEKPRISTPTPNRGVSKGRIKTSTNIIPAVSGTLYYEMMVWWYANADDTVMKKYNDKVFSEVDKNFGKYMDAKSTVSPKRYHHVYEWNSIGQKPGRLWKLRKRNSGSSSFQIRYDFLTSKRVAPIHPSLKIPGKNGKVVKKSAIFARKAYVMEEGLPVTIKRRSANWLAMPKRYEFTGPNNIFFAKGPVRVANQGGREVKFSFARTFDGYFSSGLATKQLQDGRVLDTPARITKRVGEDVPSAIYRVSSSRGVDKGFIEGIAKARVLQAAAREY